MNYEDKRRREKFLWDKIGDNKALANNLLNKDVPLKIINYKKNVIDYIIEDSYDFLNNSYTLNVNLELKKFPRNFLPYIKVISIFKTESAYEVFDFVSSITPLEDIKIIKTGGTSHYCTLDFFDRLVYQIKESEDETEEDSYVIKGSLYAYAQKITISPSSQIYIPLFGKIFVHLYNIGESNEIRV